MSAPLPLAQAQERLLALVEPLGGEPLPVAKCAGRYLAEPLIAARNQPAADLSAMDGYAVHGGGPWTIIGESRAGAPFSESLAAGQAVRISTGAHLPRGSERVLLQEDAVRKGEQLRATASDDPAAHHIRRAGFDFALGDHLLDAGGAIGPAQIALALAAGHANLAVGRKPSVAIMDCGDELSADPANCEPHQLPASNGAMLAAMLKPLASNVTLIGPVPDDREALAAALERAAACDVLVTSGGASVGDHDLIRPALEDWGARIDFWRVAMKPGKPLLVATRGEQTILGLPGNPVSSFVTAFLFAVPLLRHLAGAGCAIPRAVTMRAGCDLPPGGPRQQFLRGRMADGQVYPMDEQDSSALRALAHATLLIERPIDAPGVKARTDVPVYPL